MNFPWPKADDPFKPKSWHQRGLEALAMTAKVFWFIVSLGLVYMLHLAIHPYIKAVVEHTLN